MSTPNPYHETEHVEFSSLVMEHYEDPFQRGPCPGVTHAGEAKCTCGSIVRVELRLTDEEELEAFWFDGEGCVASQAAASILAEMATRMSLEELQQSAPIELLIPFGDALPASQKECVLLSYNVLQEALAHPVDPEFDTEYDGGGRPTFGGPDLGDEC